MDVDDLSMHFEIKTKYWDIFVYLLFYILDYHYIDFLDWSQILSAKQSSIKMTVTIYFHYRQHLFFQPNKKVLMIIEIENCEPVPHSKHISKSLIL